MSLDCGLGLGIGSHYNSRKHRIYEDSTGPSGVGTIHAPCSTDGETGPEREGLA